MNQIKILCFVTVVSLLNACGGSSGGGSNDANTVTVTTNFTGTRPSVEQIYSESLITSLEMIGLNINLGDNPPNVEGSYLLEPRVLQATTVPVENIEIGVGNGSTTITFSNQNNANLTLDLEANSGSTNVVDTGSFISGSGNLFTVYFVAEVTVDGHTFDSTETYSGVITDGGVQNLQRAIFVLDDRGDPNDGLIPNDTGRLFIDEDGLSVRVLSEAAANVFAERLRSAPEEAQKSSYSQ